MTTNQQAEMFASRLVATRSFPSKEGELSERVVKTEKRVVNSLSLASAKQVLTRDEKDHILRNQYGDIWHIPSGIAEQLPDWFRFMAIRACECYEEKTARILKAHIRDDVVDDPVGAVERWTPFVKNTLEGAK